MPTLVKVDPKIKAQNDKEDAEKEAAMIKEVRGRYYHIISLIVYYRENNST